jgi:uncharacterized membrane protein
MRKRPTLQRLFLTGVLTLLPLWLTWIVVKFVFVLLSDTSRPLTTPLLARLALAWPRLLGWFESLVARIPFASTIYGSARQLLDILQTKPDGTQRVVLIDFPHDQMKSIGFVTRVLKEHGTGRELAAVYVPTTPNPTSGYLEIVPVERITPTDWSVDQAMSFIISGGAVSPDAIPFSPPERHQGPGSL